MNEMHISKMVFCLVKKNSELLQIYLIYRDYNYLITDKKGSNIKTLKHNLEFIINKCLKSTQKDVVTLGETLLEQSTEILNTYSNKTYMEFQIKQPKATKNKIKKRKGHYNRIAPLIHKLTDFFKKPNKPLNFAKGVILYVQT